MTPHPLRWSEPRPTGYASIHAADHHGTWRITPVPRDVARVRLDPLSGMPRMVDAGYAGSVDEARLLIDVLRAGTEHLDDWHVQLELAGFSRTYPDAGRDCVLSDIWQIDAGADDMIQIVVRDRPDGRSVHATHERDGDTFWTNVCRVEEFETGADGTRFDSGLPEGTDTLKAGVAAAIAILDARRAQGSVSLATPVGGPIAERRIAA